MTITLADPTRFLAARAVVTAGLAARAYPAAVVEAGRAAGPLWREAFGRLTYAAGAPAVTVGTIFDLASLTKVIATASLTMRAVAARRVALETRLADLRPAWRRADRAEVTIRHLLDHSSGLPAHMRLWERAQGRDAFARTIDETPLERVPGVQSVYSDPGFMLLGFVLEDLAGASLDAQFAPLALEVGGSLGYRPAEDLVERIAPTEDDPWRGRVLRGEVHDENAAALGGVAAHAGLFGTAAAVGSFARLVLKTFTQPSWLGSPELMRTFSTRTGVPASSRALGWDTMLPTSSCGTRMSPTAIGHTGFTGTSLWIDREKDLYVVWLTNRVHPTRANDALVSLRPRFHDAALDGLAALER
jgi:CubicO group peptidase (beta-lactamase class C family)